MFDPLSAVLAAALYGPLVLNSTKAWKPTDEADKLISTWNETDRPLVSIDLETNRLLVKPSQSPVQDRVASLLEEIKRYGNLPHGWDGERSVAPTEACISAASAFVTAFPGGLPLPVPMVSSSGEVGFYWNEMGGYADLQFDASGAGSFFSKEISGIEVYKEALSVSDFSPAWLFRSLGAITAPMTMAA